MSAPVKLVDLYRGHREQLSLTWLNQAHCPDCTITLLHYTESDISLIGHLNLIYPNCIQVLGKSEIEYLKGLGKNSYNDVIKALFQHKPGLILLSDNQKAPELLLEVASKQHLPIWCSPLPSFKLINYLQYYLTDLLIQHTVFHGVFMEVMGLGVLMTGPSGIGKSEIALDLINRGHRLIADDAPEFFQSAPDTIIGTCPLVLRDFLEVRGLGILNIRSMFGDSAISKEQRLQLIIRLEQMSDEAMRHIDRLQGNRHVRTILDVEIQEVTLPVTPGRGLAVMVEAAVRNHLLVLKGYSASDDFLSRHQQAIDQQGNS